MSPTRMARLAGIFLSLLSLASAQGVLVNGNSQLPDCAKGCTLLNQAAQACSATSSANTQAWVCFCQSAYLINLRSSAVGICDQVCTDATQNQQVSTWYRTNCGNDNGATAHASDTGGGGSTNNQQQGSGGTGTQANAPSGTTTTVATASPASNAGNGGWFANHYQWIIMLIVLLIGLSGLGWLLTWLRKRWERKQDQTTNGFNAGVTTQVAPSGRSDPNAGHPRVVEPSGRDSAARTRDSYMPYGYNYSRSQSRAGSRSSGIHEQQRRTPAPRGVSPLTDREKEMAVGGDLSDSEITKAPRRGVLVRERSGPESMNGEKF